MPCRSLLMSKALVTVVLVNWNGVDILPSALNSLRNQAYKNFNIMLVDNNSQDESIQMLQSQYPEVQIIAEKQNHGFAKAVNIAVSKMHTKYFALLNTDAVAHKDWLRNLVRTIDTDTKLAVVTAVSLLPGGKKIDAYGDEMSRWGVAFPKLRGQDTTTLKDQGNAQIFSGSGGYSIYSTGIWREVGGFDQSFFMYYEDVDYCYRVRLYGYNVKLASDAYITHSLGASSSRRGKNFFRRYVIRNAQCVYWKNTPSEIILRTLLRFCLTNLYMILAGIKSFAFKELITAYGGFLISIPYIYRQRRKIQSHTQVSWRVIYSLLSPIWPFSSRREK